MQIQKATRQKVKLRLGLSAVSGGGKTYSALLLAKGLCGSWNKIGVIDTENKSASLYSHLGDFNTIELDPPFSPERYVEAVKMFEAAGAEVIIIDSITHEWDGKGGILAIADSMPGNSFTNWAKLTPRHQLFIDAILQSKSHIITTVRRKQDYEMTKDSSGKVTVQKAGLKEITREGFEYELTLNMELDIKNNATASKDRTGLFANKPAFVITEQTGELIRQWCETGAEAATPPIEPPTKPEPPKTTPPPAEPKERTLEELEAIDQWKQVINNCTTIEEISKKYKENKKLWEDTPEIFAAFTAKGTELRKKQPK